MHWRRWGTPAALLLAWAVLAAWQWQEYQTEAETARDALRRQAESISNALVGGVRSHRRVGRFVEEQLQAALDELAKSRDVLAVAVVSSDNRLRLLAGRGELLKLDPPLQAGGYWDEQGFRQIVAFQVVPEAPGPMQPGPGQPGMGPEPFGPPPIAPLPNNPATNMPQPEFNTPRPETSAGEPSPPQNGSAPGRRSGWGRNAPERQPFPLGMGMPEAAPFGGRFYSVLLLDRSSTDRQIRHYAWLRAVVVAAGGVVILSIALAWRATMRLAEAHGKAQLLEIEARHLRDLSQAAAGLAHETRNPLGSIRGWTQRWMQATSDKVLQQQAQAVIEECDRVTARINQFLAFARSPRPKLSPTRPAEIISQLAALLEPDLEAKQLKLVADFSELKQTFQADAEMLRQALFNLARNAVEFSPSGAAVEISLRRSTNGAWRMEVADRGPGVAPEATERLFTPYYSTRSNGAGLGLAIVRRIAVAHGWRAGYSPRPGGGAIFWLDGIREG